MRLSLKHAQLTNKTEFITCLYFLKQLEINFHLSKTFSDALTTISNKVQQMTTLTSTKDIVAAVKYPCLDQKCENKILRSCQFGFRENRSTQIRMTVQKFFV